jgi:hypothetical protein
VHGLRGARREDMSGVWRVWSSDGCGGGILDGKLKGEGREGDVG